MIVSAIIALSQIDAYSMVTHLKLQKSMYICEGMLNRVQWLIIAERARHAQTSINDFDYEDYAYDRFLPDGVVHEMDYHGTPMRFTITDAAAGLDSAPSSIRSTILYLTRNQSSGQSYLEAMRLLRERLNDYLDPDDVTAGDGMEKDDFEQENRKPLPRNGSLQYREEFFFIPGFTDLFPPDKDGRISAFRIIIPQRLATVQTGFSTPTPQPGNPGIVRMRLSTSRRQNTAARVPHEQSIFGISNYYLKNVIQLEDNEIELVNEAVKKYQNERIPFSDSLESTLMLKLKPYLLWTASGSYVIRIEGAKGTGPMRRLSAAYTSPENPAGPSDGVIRYFEWLFF